MILIYKILNFALGDWRVRGVYLIIDSYEIILFTFTIFKRAINYFQNYLMQHVLTEENFDSRVKIKMFYIKYCKIRQGDLYRATYTGRLKDIIVSVSG